MEGKRGEELKLNKRSCDPRQLVNGSRLTAVPEETTGSVVSTPGFSFLLFLKEDGMESSVTSLSTPSDELE